jgi:hypothetical protein
MSRYKSRELHSAGQLGEGGVRLLQLPKEVSFRLASSIRDDEDFRALHELSVRMTHDMRFEQPVNRGDSLDDVKNFCVE